MCGDEYREEKRNRNMNYQYLTCKFLENHTLRFYDRIDTGEPCITLCCEPVDANVEPPSMPFLETAEKTLDAYLELRKSLIQESREIASGKVVAPVVTAGCTECALYSKNHWLADDRIRYIYLTMYPSPCQCRCIYCNEYRNGNAKMPVTEAAKDAYEKLFRMLELCLERNLISEDAQWSVACGEITVHPYRERILDMVKGRHTTFYSNCFKFDERIAEHLGQDHRSGLCLSIDAGTSEAWEKVKGVNNFNTVVENLERYAAHCIYPDQLELKYIILPGLNDTEEDIENIVALAKRLNLTALSISRDLCGGMKSCAKEKDTAARLIARCFQNGINASSGLLFPHGEKLEIKSMAWELLQSR